MTLVSKQCPVCGLEFSRPKSHAHAKFCGRDCWYKHHAARRKICAECGTTFTGWADKFCSRACFTRNRSQQRPVPCALCGKVIMRRPSDDGQHCAGCFQKASGLTRKGTKPPHLTDPEARKNWLAALQSEEHRKAQAERMTGFEHVKPQSMRNSPSHSCAVEFFVRSPANIVYYVRNICAFVNANRELFDEADLVNKSKTSSYSSNATHGLGVLHTGRRNTWKGWMLVSGREGREPGDLLNRKNL